MTSPSHKKRKKEILQKYQTVLFTSYCSVLLSYNLKKKNNNPKIKVVGGNEAVPLNKRAKARKLVSYHVTRNCEKEFQLSLMNQIFKDFQYLKIQHILLSHFYPCGTKI